jgi:hypothetical protein
LNDVHCHVLPGIDDRARDLEDASSAATTHMDVVLSAARLDGDGQQRVRREDRYMRPLIA